MFARIYAYYIFSLSVFRRKSRAIVIVLSSSACSSCKTLTFGHSSKTFQNIRMKLFSHVARDNMHMYSKGHYPDLNNHWVMPLFRLWKITQTSVGVRSAALLLKMGKLSAISRKCKTLTLSVVSAWKKNMVEILSCKTFAQNILFAINRIGIDNINTYSHYSHWI